MKFKEFERIAVEAFEAIPDRYREGIEGLVVSREAVPHPNLPDIYTLGHCDTETYPSEWTGPETTRSVVVLYYGSFKSLARLDPEFDWEAEIVETVEHEVRHHLEALASDDALEGVDYALDEDFKRAEGLEFDPWYYQKGDAAGRDVYVVEDHVFLEQECRAEELERTGEVRFRWRGKSYLAPAPDPLGDVHYLRVLGVEGAPPLLELVLVRRAAWWEGVKRWARPSRPLVAESEADAGPGEAAPG